MNLKNVKLWILDFDGVLTDNKVFINECGEEMVQVSRADGCAVEILKTKGVKVIVVSSEKNQVVKRRCEKLNIPCFYGVKSKKEMVDDIIKQEEKDYKDILYIGNDINDLEVFMLGCVKIAPKDAAQSIKDVADIVLNTEGGNGVLRELVYKIWSI